MLDGVNGLAAGIARDFPHAEMIAYYITGQYAWTPAEVALFPHAAHVTIVTILTNAGDVADCERGDLIPGQLEAWITMRHAAGLYKPTVYCSLSIVPEVRAGTGKHILGRDYDIWYAHYDNSPVFELPPGQPAAEFAAKQYLNTPTHDVSVVRDGWPQRQAPGPPPPPPAKPSILSLVATAHYSDGTAKTVQL
jgi:hypothetical protein